jgi:hypothetical protein
MSRGAVFAKYTGASLDLYMINHWKTLLLHMEDCSAIQGMYDFWCICSTPEKHLNHCASTTCTHTCSA